MALCDRILNTISACSTSKFVTMMLIVFKYWLRFIPKRQLVIRNKLPKGPIRAFWIEARMGCGVDWCAILYTNGNRSPCGLRDARKGIGIQSCLGSIYTCRTQMRLRASRNPQGIRRLLAYRHTIERRSPISGFAPKAS